MEALAATFITAATLNAAASMNLTSKEALSEFFAPDRGSFQFDARKRALELCLGLCEYYEMRGGPTNQAWDTVFLHQYYFVAPGYRDEFRDRYSSLAQSLVERYTRWCPAVRPGNLPACIVKVIGSRSYVAYASVRYDEGYRCQVWGSLTNPKYQGKGKCTKVKHAS